MGAETDTYFPEQLVKDLEMSAAMFAAKNLSAGVPLSSSFVDDKGRLRTSLFPYRRSISPGLHSGPSHIPSLGPIEERESIVSFLNQRGYHEDSTDGDSFTDTDGSGAMVPPSVPLREQSVVTAATSLTSSGNLPSPSGFLPCDKSRIYSWIEADSDMEDHDYTADDKAGFLSPRPPTPPQSDNSFVAVKGQQGGGSSQSHAKRSRHRRSQSLAIEVSTKLPQRRLSGRSAKAKLQSTPPQRAQADFHHSTTTFGGPGWTPRQGSPPAHAVMETPLPEPMEIDEMSSLASLVAMNSHIDDDIDYDDNDSMYPAVNAKPTSRNEVYIRPSPPPSPPPTVQHLLTGSVQNFSIPSSLDDAPRVVPLPPEVIETLRVSVTCFPETMLLTSSLTLETIRTYAKKVRHPHLGSITLRSQSPPRHNPGRSIWRKVSSYRRGGRFSKEDMGDMDVVPELPKPWMVVKNIFGGASDYICDALYAHAVAYNYISALVPAHHSPPNACPSPTLSTGDDIPRKAASLLGLSQKDSATDGQSAPRSSSGPLSSWRRNSRHSSQPSSPTYLQQEAALRDVQAGLTRCVMGLVATARTMAEEEGKGIGKGVVVLEGRAGDEYLMRSLLEVVRLSEELC